jgi:hypothetical protein
MANSVGSSEMKSIRLMSPPSCSCSDARFDSATELATVMPMPLSRSFPKSSPGGVPAPASHLFWNPWDCWCWCWSCGSGSWCWCCSCRGWLCAACDMSMYSFCSAAAALAAAPVFRGIMGGSPPLLGTGTGMLVVDSSAAWECSDSYRYGDRGWRKLAAWRSRCHVDECDVPGLADCCCCCCWCCTDSSSDMGLETEGRCFSFPLIDVDARRNMPRSAVPACWVASPTTLWVWRWRYGVGDCSGARSMSNDCRRAARSSSSFAKPRDLGLCRQGRVRLLDRQAWGYASPPPLLPLGS